MNKELINIGLMGFGNIGTGTYTTLEMNRDLIRKKDRDRFEITKILEKDVDRKRDIVVSKDKFTQDPDDLFSDPDIDIVVELLGGIQPATDFMLRAMEHGKHVVTANKAAVAANYDILREAAEKNKVMFRYEASVGGGIPILSRPPPFRNSFIEIQILNGTTNYIFSNDRLRTGI